MKKQNSRAVTIENDDLPRKTIPARLKALRGKWKGVVTLLEPIYGIPNVIFVDYKFNARGNKISGTMSFQSPDPSRGMIENVFKGQFMSEKLVQLRYEKRAKHIIGYGTVSLELSPDMQELRGHNSGLSSHTGKLFVSNVFLKKDDGSKATSCFEAEYLRSLSLSPRVFIGHGKDRQWRELENHLREKQGFTVVGYELGVRAGCTVVEVLSEMLEKSSIAFLVMTAEDKMDSGEMRARQNVVHEIGLFQGRLGFKRAIVLVEDGVEEFRNITGLNPIPFAAGRIQEIFGDVVAIIRREFPAQVPAR